ncbi:MAG: ASCH domain-containing protein [Alphaproteobacteria bacterium]|nr:ASCH domain-containing protein [Alphaproteobacteria bacterium]
MHKLKVKEKYYNMLKLGIKTIELRLFDEKRRNIKIGDTIEFSNNSDVNDTFTAKVINLHRASSFAELCKNIDCHKAGFPSNEKLIDVLEEFYSKDRQSEVGVVGIEIQKK